MLKYIAGLLIGMVAFIALFVSFGQLTGNAWWAPKPERYVSGTCLKLAFPGTESWESDIIGQVQTVGKNSYEMKHWIEYGWSHTSGTWPFTVEVAKVECPKETYDGVQ